MSPTPMMPRATYRLQFNGDFTLDDGAALVPYLDRLGISHIYASPLLKARSGSSHGYDIVEHDSLNPEVGGEEALARLTDALRARGMGLILDVVPNHMGVMGRDNPWWLDVLEHGPASRRAGYFDIDWDPLKDELRGKVLVPVLGDHYGNVLDSGELVLAHDPAEGTFAAEYYEHRFPIDPREYPRLFAHRTDDLAGRLGEDGPAAAELASLLTAFGNLPPRSAVSAAERDERARDSAIHKRRLADLRAEYPQIARFMDEVVADYNGAGRRPGDAALFHRLLEAQAWRLAYWRVATDEINYRRFFDINDLAALRMEDEEVFRATHGKVLEMVAAGRVQGLRIDHPDGLYDPAAYFERLQAAARSVGRPAAGSDPGSDAEAGTGLYVVVEKILAAGEQLPTSWPVAGSTGYEFARSAGGLFVAARNEAEMDRIYRSFAFADGDFRAVERNSRLTIMQDALASELAVLATELARIAEMDTHTRDFTRSALREGISAVVACFPVYRTYVTRQGCSEEDAGRIEAAVGEARRRAALPDESLFDFLRDVLVTRRAEAREARYRDRVVAFAIKFQQFTGPVAAKGVEDTALYRYQRLISLNEVGGAPDRFGTPAAEFHRDNAARLAAWPGGLLAGSTHDAKRSLDVRMRIHALSEWPAEWEERVARWHEATAPLKHEVDGRMAPSANDEYFLYQTLVGAWPAAGRPGGDGWEDFVQRIRAYLRKAFREAKRHTEWESPDPDYEAAVQHFVAGVLDPAQGSAFLHDFLPFQQRIAAVGRFNSLAFLALEYTAPGVPDMYQGDELPDYRLVDPDNRRPVAFQARSAALTALELCCDGNGYAPASLVREAVGDPADGSLRLQLVRRCLALRRRWPSLFARGEYLPLTPRGEHADHVCGFCRRDEGRWLMTVVPRLVGGLCDGRPPVGKEIWDETALVLPAGLEPPALRHLCTGETLRTAPSPEGRMIRAADALRSFPVGVFAAANQA